MNRKIVLRLILYFIAIMSLAVLIGVMARNSWRRIEDSNKQLREQGDMSFQFDADIRNKILKLNNLMVRYAAHPDTNVLEDFKTNRDMLKQFLDEHKPILSPETESEKNLLNNIYKNIYIDFANYIAAAGKLENRRYVPDSGIARLDEISGDLNKYSTNILNRSFQLAAKQQEYIGSKQNQNSSSINILRYELLGALVILIVVGYWVGAGAYRELVASLNVQLVESRRLAERQEKLASLGLLAAGVAHEIRNPLTSIKIWFYLQQKNLKPGTPEFDDAELIGGEINRLERIVRDFLQLARPSEPELTTVPADHPLREAQMLMKPQLEKAGVDIVLGETINAPIRIDPQQIKQVLLNLIQNAADSIDHQGTVTLGARLDKKNLNGHEMDVVILEVTDTGKGISPDAEKRLFDPFFTTKENGTGLGLPISARIVEKHHGALEYQTRPNHGTTFGIVLPRHKS